MGSDPITRDPITPPILVFGGPYSNLRATQAMRARAAELGIPPSSTICTGDVVAYCAEPEETTALVRDWGCHVIAGNCEEQLAAAAEDCACGFEEGSECDRLAKGWYPFANARLSPASRAWMAALPKTLTFALGGLRFRVIHGGVDLINRFVFASERDVLAEELERAGADVVIAGHAGVPFIERIGRRTWFNPGVIGMPANDGSADVWYGLIELDAGRIVLSTHRLAYDHVAAAAAVRRAGHADGYARTLITGVWPSLDIFPPARARRHRQAPPPPHPAPRIASGSRVGRSPLPACGERERAASISPRRLATRGLGLEEQGARRLVDQELLRGA